MGNKINLGLLNLIVFYIFLRFGHTVDLSWQPILFFTTILTVVHVFDIIFDKFNILANKIITFLIVVIVFIHFIVISVNTF